MEKLSGKSIEVLVGEVSGRSQVVQRLVVSEKEDRDGNGN